MLTYTWASGYFRKTQRTVADEAAVQPERKHTSGRATVGRNTPKCETPEPQTTESPADSLAPRRRTTDGRRYDHNEVAEHRRLEEVVGCTSCLLPTSTDIVGERVVDAKSLIHRDARRRDDRKGDDRKSNPVSHHTTVTRPPNTLPTSSPCTNLRRSASSSRRDRSPV